MEQNRKSRRDFLKGSLAVGATGLVVGLAGCSSAAETDAPVAETAAEATSPIATTAPAEAVCPTETAATTTAPAATTYSFETVPAPIAESDIVTKKSADVVVLGAGLAGMCAAYAAADAGASVILLEKRETFTYHGGWNASMGDRVHEAAGVVVPKDQVMADIMRFGAYHANARLIQTWENECGRIMNKILDIADAAGVAYILDTDNKEHWPYTEFSTCIQFLPAMNGTLLPMLEAAALAKGVEILYETPAVQLIRPDKAGKVTGVVAQNADGYVQVDAAKGVIICTGCYGSNKEMLAKYEPRALKIQNNQYSEGSNTGDGIIMGMWIGAAKQATSCPMLWDGLTTQSPIFINIARQPFLNVNVLGERYANEDAPFGFTANQDIQQPESMKWTVWDANWKEDAVKLHGTVCENMQLNNILWNDTSYDSYKEAGIIIEADTLDELADKMGIPKETFLATVARYNELVANGVDDDFGKDPEKLTDIAQAPFGAAKTGAGLLVTLDGLRITTGMEVLDTEGKVIPGLYAAGNASGDFFSNDYPITSTGSSHGRAYTFGWLAGENAAKA